MDKQQNPMPRVDEKERAIVEAARSTFLANGFDAASMDAIALTAGVSKRTVYNRFRSKEELFAAAIMETCRRILPIDIHELEISSPPERFMREMAKTFLTTILEPEAVALRRIAAFEAGRKPELGMTYLEHGPRLMAHSISPILERIAKSGDYRIDDVDAAVWRLGALLTEPLFTEVLMGCEPEDMDAAIQKQIDAGLSAFAKIYAAPSEE